MTTVVTINRHTCQLLRQHMDAALATVAAQFGVSITVGNMRFNANSIRAPIEIKVRAQPNAADVAAVPITAEALQHLRMLFGNNKLTGAERFVTAEQEFTVTDYVARRHSYPWSVVNRYGKRYKISNSMLRNCTVKA